MCLQIFPRSHSAGAAPFLRNLSCRCQLRHQRVHRTARLAVHHKGESPHARNSAPAAQPRNPLHGVTLEAIVRALEARYGWPALARQVPVRCFTLDPSVSSSLKFLRKTPWAREKVEALYLDMLRKDRRSPASTD